MAAYPNYASQDLPLHVLRIVAGPSGNQVNGTFVLNEERSVFNRGDDRDVIVVFQWEGRPGQHKLIAQWRSPDGAATSNSTVNYLAKDRKFGAYWRLSLSPTMPTGTWAIEATVDDEPAGRFTFEITDSKVDASKARRPLTQAMLFERLGRMFVSIERFSAAGRKLDSFSGLIGLRGRIYTTIGAIDDVDRLRAVLPNGTARDVADVYAWSRKQDWAVLEALADSGPEFAVASPESIHIGDRCFSIEGSPTGGRVLTELTITGQRSGSGPGGGGWLATVASEFATPGAPVLNEYGEVVGVIGTGLTGATRLPLIARLRAELKGAPVVPLASFRVPDVVAPTPMTALLARGELVPALAREQNVLSGGFAHEIARTNTVAFSDQREEFSVQEKTFVAFVSWAPVENLKGQTKLQLFDEENRLVLESNPKKINIGKRDMSLSSWAIPAAKLAPGTYRADVALDGKPIWRGFVKITP
jgi:S1-C subfamily serine protease